MTYAGHLPTKQFTLAEWSAMPVWVPKDEGECPPDGWCRMINRRGKPIVGYWPPVNLFGEVGFAVRPVVRVQMRRRVVS